MTNNIAHELKTPVTSIRGYLETLLQQHEISPDKQRFFLDRAYTQALRLSDLIRDVALITKIEEATDLFERKPVDLKQVVEEVIADHKNTLDAHRVQIVDRIGRGTTVEGNHTLLYSIFWNLTDNAVNYAGEGVTITIEQYAEDDDFYYFSFHDNGCGVPEADLEKIFVRFYRDSDCRSSATRYCTTKDASRPKTGKKGDSNSCSRWPKRADRNALPPNAPVAKKLFATGAFS